MFCDGVEDVEYYIFNQQIDKERYKMLEKQYKKYIDGLLEFVSDWPSELVSATYCAPTLRFDDWYHSIPTKFWKWARTLPGYDSMFLYNMTMFPEILMD